MKNTFGNNLTVTLTGESHGEAICCVIDGMSPGVKIDLDYINQRLLERSARGNISTPRHEGDEVTFLSGVKDGYTEGTPILILIRNTNVKSSSYALLENIPRPSHADFAAECKYHGFQDKRGGGHFSGRVTAALTAAGAICRCALEDKGVFIATHIKSLSDIEDRDFDTLPSDTEYLKGKDFPVLDAKAAALMTEKILAARELGDSVGGVLETVVYGHPAGLGEPWFDTVEGMLSHILFSVPGIKGVEFGDGFGISRKMGSEANDPFTYDGGEVVCTKNSNGGINGGITNGMPILFRCAIKPTPSISIEQNSVNLMTGEDTKISITGRHDPAIIHRARAVVDAVTAIAMADMLITRFGADFLATDKPST